MKNKLLRMAIGSIAPKLKGLSQRPAALRTAWQNEAEKARALVKRNSYAERDPAGKKRMTARWTDQWKAGDTYAFHKAIKRVNRIKKRLGPDDGGR